MKTLLIRQPAGIGDILFCMKIAKIYQDKGYDILWPINDNHMYLNNYLKKNFQFVPMSSNFLGKDLFKLNIKNVIDTHDFLFLPLEVASHILPGHPMEMKYKLSNVDMGGYQEFFEFTRNKQREDELFFNKLDLMDGISKYKLCNRNYASLPDVRHFNSSFINTGGKEYQVDMIVSEGSHVFDWCKVVENSSEFHTVGTSITFLCEHLNVSNTKLFMYRRPENTISQFREDSKLFKKDWRFIE